MGRASEVLRLTEMGDVLARAQHGLAGLPRQKFVDQSDQLNAIWRIAQQTTMRSSRPAKVKDRALRMRPSSAKTDVVCGLVFFGALTVVLGTGGYLLVNNYWRKPVVVPGLPPVDLEKAQKKAREAVDASYAVKERAQVQTQKREGSYQEMLEEINNARESLPQSCTKDPYINAYVLDARVVLDDLSKHLDKWQQRDETSQEFLQCIQTAKEHFKKHDELLRVYLLVRNWQVQATGVSKSLQNAITAINYMQACVRCGTSMSPSELSRAVGVFNALINQISNIPKV